MPAWEALFARADRAVQRAFGDTRLYQPKSGPAFSISGIFDAAWKNDKLGNDQISTLDPALHVVLSEFPQPPQQDDRVTINEQQYEVYDVQPDGYGGATLQLHLVS